MRERDEQPALLVTEIEKLADNAVGIMAQPRDEFLTEALASCLLFKSKWARSRRGNGG
jgi:hypothetical protein